MGDGSEEASHSIYLSHTHPQSLRGASQVSGDQLLLGEQLVNDIYINNML